MTLLASSLLESFANSLPSPAGLVEGSGLMSNPDFWKVANLLVFVLILFYILRNKVGIGRVFDRRGEAIVKELEDARREKRQAQEKLEEVLGRLKRLDQEIADIKNEAEVEARKEDERLRLAAEADAEKIEQTARREIEAAMKAARSELRAFVAEHSVAMAEGTIRQEMRAEDGSRLLSDYARDLAAAGKGNK